MIFCLICCCFLASLHTDTAWKRGFPMSQAKNSDRFIMVHQIFESPKWRSQNGPRCRINIAGSLVDPLLKAHWYSCYWDSHGCISQAFSWRLRWISLLFSSYGKLVLRTSGGDLFKFFNSVVVRSLMSSNRNQVTIFIAGCIFMIFWCGPIFPGCGQRSKVILDHIHDPPKYPPQK